MSVEDRILIAEIERLAAAVAACWDDLSPNAKAAAINLGHTLSRIRLRLLRPSRPSYSAIGDQPLAIAP